MAPGGETDIGRDYETMIDSWLGGLLRNGPSLFPPDFDILAFLALLQSRGGDAGVLGGHDSRMEACPD